MEREVVKRERSGERGLQIFSVERLFCRPRSAHSLSCSGCRGFKGILNKSSAVAEMGDCLATIDMGRKMTGLQCPFPCGGAGSPSNAMSPGLRPTAIRRGILIHPAVSPQQTWAENWAADVPLWGLIPI